MVLYGSRIPLDKLFHIRLWELDKEQNMKRKWERKLKSKQHKNLSKSTKTFLFSTMAFLFAFYLLNTSDAGFVPKSEMPVVQAASQKTIPLKLYKKIKGRWSDNSSGGYNRIIKKNCIKVYDRSTGKLAYKSKIYGCKKTDNGYLIKCKYPHNNAKYCYVYNEQNDCLDYYFDSWEARGDNYSGSSSLSRGWW